MKMKKITLAITALTLLLGLAGCGAAPAVSQPEPTAGMPSPIFEVSAQELLEKTGISFNVPEGAENLLYCYIDDGSGDAIISQLRFDLGDSDVTVRAQAAPIPEGELPDISGMYYEWSETDEAELGYNTARVFWNEGSEGYVTWYDYAPGLLYCLSMTGDADRASLLSLASQCCPPVQGEVGDGTAMDSMTPPREPASFFPEAILPVTVDLNGDGKNETLSVRVENGDESFGDHSLVLTDDAGREHVVQTYIQYNSTVCAGDIDGDGRFELFFTGDCGSDDYITYAWRWDGELESIPFKGEVRGGGDGGMTAYVDGTVVAIDAAETESAPALIDIESFTYMLGTYGSRQAYSLSDDGCIAPVGSWTFVNNDIWLTTAMELNAQLSGQSQALPAGTKLLLTGTNGADRLDFKLEDDSAGSFTVSYSTDGYGWRVDGIPETEAFASLPYAG